MRGWFLFFAVSLGVGGFFALAVALARTPFVSSYLPSGIFYHWLVGHVDSTLLVGLLSFLFFLWHTAFKVEGGPLPLFLCGIGFLSISLTSLLGLGKALFNNYVPTIVHPLFFLGLLLFGVGYASVTLSFLREALSHILSGGVRSVLSVSVVLSLALLISAVLSITRASGEPLLYFERLYWIPGHIHQFVNASLLIASWFLLSDFSGFKVPNGIAHLSLLLIPFPLLFLAVQIFGSDPLSPEVRRLTTLGYAVGIGVPTLAVAVYLLFKVAFRYSFWGKVLGLSLIFYLLGASMGYLIAGSDLRVPAHYHAVIASILIAVMGLTYRFLQEMGYAKELPKFIKLQPFLYWLGMLLFVLGLFVAGLKGTPRKVFGTEYITDPVTLTFMGLMGVGSVLSVIGGATFVLFVLYSILTRKGVRYEEEGRTKEEGEHHDSTHT